MNPDLMLESRSFATVRLFLRLVVAVECWGVAAKHLQTGAPTHLGTLLAGEANWSTSSAAMFDQYSAYALIVAGLLTLLRPCWPVLLPVTVWLAAIPAAAWHMGQGYLPAMEPLEHGARYLAPLALLLIEFWPPDAFPSIRRTTLAMWLLRLGAAATFTGHGIVALAHNPQFFDLIHSATNRFLGWEFSSETTPLVLSAIGIVDVAVAINLLAGKQPPVALYAAFWGFVTAASRVIHFGWEDGYYEMLLRAANGGAPLVLFLYWALCLPAMRRLRESAPSQPSLAV